MEETKKDRIIKIIKLSLLIGTIICSIIFFIKACKKVNAVMPENYTMTFNLDDVFTTDTASESMNVYKLDYFDLYNLLTTQNGKTIQRYTFDYNNYQYYFTYDIYSDVNGYVLIVGYYDGSTYRQSTVQSYYTNENMENRVLCTGFVAYEDAQEHKIRLLPILYNLECNTPSEGIYIDLDNKNILTEFTTNDLTNIIVTSKSYNQYWVSSRVGRGMYAPSDSRVKGQLISIIRTTNAHNIEYVYRNQYLFGDLVSSFLNIQLGAFDVGGVTHYLTLGMLLFFILGLGALFIVLKIMMGG